MNSADGITFETLTDLHQISDLAADWDSLLERTTCDRAFSSWQWYLAFCGHRPGLRPHVVTARRGPRLAGILPLVVGDGRAAASIAESADYTDMIAAADDTPLMAATLRHAVTAGRGYEKVILAHLRRDSNCVRAAKALQPALDLEHRFRVDNHCPYIRLPATYDDYLRSKSANFRQSLRRKRRLAEGANLVLGELKPDHFPSDRLADVFLGLHLIRHGPKSFFRPGHRRAFVRQMLPGLFAAATIRAFALSRGEHVLALNLTIANPRSLGYWNGGMLPEAGRWSAGSLLLAEGIRSACALGLEEYDLLRGTEPYKARWANDVRAIGRLELAVSR